MDTTVCQHQSCCWPYWPCRGSRTSRKHNKGKLHFNVVMVNVPAFSMGISSVLAICLPVHIWWATTCVFLPVVWPRLCGYCPLLGAFHLSFGAIRACWLFVLGLSSQANHNKRATPSPRQAWSQQISLKLISLFCCFYISVP